MSLSPLKNKQIEAFHDKGLTVKEIGRKTHCSHAEIRQLLKSKGKEPIEEKTKEKEPATAATVTDSQKTDVVTDNSTVSISKDTTIEAKCQVLTKALKLAHKGILAQYEEMSHECQLAFDLGQLFAEIEQRMKEGGIEVE